MLEVLGITGPIYLVIAIGYAAVRWGLLQSADMRVLGRFVTAVAVPALLFRAVARLHIGEVLHLDYLAVYAAGSIATLIVGTVVAMKLRGRGLTHAAFLGLGGSSSNSAYVGYPLAAQVLGPVAAVGLALCMLVENLLVIPLGLAMAEAGGRDAHPWRLLRQTFTGLAKNPMIQGLVAGTVASLAGWLPPAPIFKGISLLADAAAPVALFVIGGSLVGLKLAGLRGDIAQVVVFKLLVHPLAIVGLLLVWPLAAPGLNAAALIFAAVPMMSIYPMLALRHGLEQMSAAALLAATVVSFVTLNLLLVALPAGWIPPH